MEYRDTGASDADKSRRQVYTSTPGYGKALARLCLLILLAPLPLAAGQPSAEQLEELKDQVRELSEAQNRDLRERDQLQSRLRDTELRIGRLSAKRQKLERQTRQAQEKLAELERQQRKLAEEKRTQLDWLARTVRASYQAGRQERLKLLLNQEQPDQIARLLRYQEYFQRARTDRLASLEGELTELQKVARKVDQARRELLSRRTELAQHEEALNEARQQREQALASVNRSIDKRSANIEQLKQDQKRLEKLLADMRRNVRRVPANNQGTPFGKLAGKLPWPLEGRISTAYNSRREGALRWDGVILGAAPGTPVRAVHAGRVVFADWLRGYGLLTIVDHGQGYLTLYGYNQSLLRDVGEWVATGDPLALAGSSGGNQTSGLYFEIRHRGKATNPARWCSRRVTLPPIALNN